MKIAMVGTRGVPAEYGGFETAVEEIGWRLASWGHHVTVYCRARPELTEYRGMERIHLPSVRHGSFETLSHSFLSALDVMRRDFDLAFVFNAANSPIVPLLKLRGVPVALHMDGLEWKRGKWGIVGRSYYKWAERLGVKVADSLIADARGIQSYYASQYSVATEYLAYGAAEVSDVSTEQLESVCLERGRYHLVVARIEPENHVDVAVDGYLRSGSQLPLVVVGSVPYRSEYLERVRQLALSSNMVRMIGSVWDQELLDSLYGGAASYIHGHSVGGTNPSLLRAMGASARVLAYDVSFNREVLGDSGRFFTSPADLGRLIADVDSGGGSELRVVARDRVNMLYQWDSVAKGYESLAERLLR